MPEAEADSYLVAHIREAIAADPAIGELGVRVRVSGDRIFLTGSVSTVERRDAITRLVRGLAGSLDVRNDIAVETPAPAGEEEKL
jgi:osmotically-inducible protein OsmY